MCDLSTKKLCPSAQKVTKTTKRKAVVMNKDSLAKVEVKLEADEEIKFPNPLVDQESMAQLEIMPKDEYEEFPVPKVEAS
jgi:endonuclease-3